MLLGKVLAEAAMRENKYVTWLPSYGAEVRGGAAYCMVCISDREIGSPYIDQADTLIVMQGPSWPRFKDRIAPKGLLLINSSLIDTTRLTQIKTDAACWQKICAFPFTDMAIKLGNIRVANMVALGCYLAKDKIVKIKTVFEVFQDFAPEDKRELVKINKLAVSGGLEVARC